ncbi:MAG TPA: hypothetical protein VFT66_15720 [Roseiflexaceae bacterium]|nr:hypothetical protein [Roseiflexaceae bacterium]
MRRLLPWLLIIVASYAAWRWQRACRGWNDAAALAAWQHDVAALSDAQIDALHALLVRHVER